MSLTKFGEIKPKDGKIGNDFQNKVACAADPYQEHFREIPIAGRFGAPLTSSVKAEERRLCQKVADLYNYNLG